LAYLARDRKIALANPLKETVSQFTRSPSTSSGRTVKYLSLRSSLEAWKQVPQYPAPRSNPQDRRAVIGGSARIQDSDRRRARMMLKERRRGREKIV
jgi:hypothetical protein